MKHHLNTTSIASAVAALIISAPIIASANDQTAQQTMEPSSSDNRINAQSRADRDLASGQNRPNTSMTASNPTSPLYRDSENMSAYQADRDQLEQALKPGRDVSSYRETLSGLGYAITAVNDRDEDYVEYEVVKGRNSFEVQIDLESGRGSDIDVVGNQWQAESTKAALEGTRVEPMNTAEFSDRSRINGWNDERSQLESALVQGKDKAYYDQKLQSMGYEITARNMEIGDDIEYEVVKGDNTYEVQIDFDDGQTQASDVEVRANLWQADGTERALERRN